MDTSGTTSFLEELTKTDDLNDVRSGGFGGVSDMQNPYWNNVQPGMNQYNTYNPINKMQQAEMMTPRTPQMHGYNSYNTNNSPISGNVMYGYTNNNGTRGSNQMWQEKAPFMHPNMANPQQPPRMGMYYNDSMQQQQQQRFSNYQNMQPMMSPRQPGAIPANKQPTSQPQPYVYQQLSSKDTHKGTDNTSKLQTKSPLQTKSKGDKQASTQQQPQSMSSLQQVNFNNHQGPLPPFHQSNQMMQDQYSYRMPSYQSQGMMLSPNSQQTPSNMKQYMGQQGYNNPMYWPQRGQYQGDMPFQMNPSNQPSYNPMQQQQQLQQQQYMQQQKHYQMQYQQGNHIQPQQNYYRHPDQAAFVQNQQPLPQFPNQIQPKPSGSKHLPYPQHHPYPQHAPQQQHLPQQYQQSKQQTQINHPHMNPMPQQPFTSYPPQQQLTQVPEKMQQPSPVKSKLGSPLNNSSQQYTLQQNQQNLVQSPNSLPMKQHQPSLQHPQHPLYQQQQSNLQQQNQFKQLEPVQKNILDQQQFNPQESFQEKPIMHQLQQQQQPNQGQQQLKPQQSSQQSLQNNMEKTSKEAVPNDPSNQQEPIQKEKPIKNSQNKQSHPIQSNPQLSMLLSAPQNNSKNNYQQPGKQDLKMKIPHYPGTHQNLPHQSMPHPQQHLSPHFSYQQQQYMFQQRSYPRYQLSPIEDQQMASQQKSTFAPQQQKMMAQHPHQQQLQPVQHPTPQGTHLQQQSPQIPHQPAPVSTATDTDLKKNISQDQPSQASSKGIQQLQSFQYNQDPQNIQNSFQQQAQTHPPNNQQLPSHPTTNNQISPSHNQLQPPPPQQQPSSQQQMSVQQQNYHQHNSIANNYVDYKDINQELKINVSMQSLNENQGEQESIQSSDASFIVQNQDSLYNSQKSHFSQPSQLPPPTQYSFTSQQQYMPQNYQHQQSQAVPYLPPPLQQQYPSQQQQFSPQPQLMSPSLQVPPFNESENLDLVSPQQFKDSTLKQESQAGSNATTSVPPAPMQKKVDDDDATLSTPPPPLLKIFNDYESESYQVNNNNNSNYNNNYNNYANLAPNSSSPSLNYTNNNITSFEQQNAQQFDASQAQIVESSDKFLNDSKIDQKKRKRKNPSEPESLDKPKRQRKSKKKKDMDDGVENIPTSSLGPEGFETSTLLEGELESGKKSKKVRKESRTPRKVKSAEELEAARLLKQQQRSEKKIRKKNKMMDGVNEVSSTVETSDPILLSEAAAFQLPINTMATISMPTNDIIADNNIEVAKPEKETEPEGEEDKAVPATESIKLKLPIRPKSKKKRPLPTVFKTKRKKKASYSGSDIEKTPKTGYSDEEKEENINKRRSARKTKRMKYMFEQEVADFEDNPTPVIDNNSDNNDNDLSLIEEIRVQDDTQTVDKILASRMIKRKVVVTEKNAIYTNNADVDDIKKKKMEGELSNEKSELIDEKPNAAGEFLNEDGVKQFNENGSEKEENKNVGNVLQNNDEPACKSENASNLKDGILAVGDDHAVKFSVGDDEEDVNNKSNIEIRQDDKKKFKDEKLNRSYEKSMGKDELNSNNKMLSKGNKEETGVDDSQYEEVEVEEFYVKYKNFSYLHCEWKTAAELELTDIRVGQKIKRFRLKQQTSFYDQQMEDEEYFNPDYVEVDRLLDMSADGHYLVKWRGLPYEECTWELAQDIDKQKIDFFMKYKDPPPESERKSKPRPRPEEWKSHKDCPYYINCNTLREYQLEGLNWLTFSYFNRQSCILADEMGLGKTIQSLTFIEEVVRYGIRGPFLIIVPLSTIANWQREFEAWTELNVVVYHGSNQSRSMIQQYEMYYQDSKGKKIPNLYKFHCLITTFEVIITDLELLRQIEWRVAVIDEAHRLKNRNCKLLQGLYSVDVEHRLLLTGTPLQNNVEELYSLLSFLEPKQFGSSESFMLEFGKLENEGQVEKLKALLKPVMLRRLKEDVEKSLAPKEETIIEVELTNIQKKYYRAILERNFAFLARGGAYASVPTLMNTMMELRKCCNHPFLINGAEDAILEEYQVTHGPQDSDKLFQTMIQASGKLVLTDKLLPKLKADGHKVLIFSQMIRVLDVIEDYLIHKKYSYERIDGRIRGGLRQEAIDRFSKPDSDRFVFLLCTRAGGLGINLTAADTVIIYDSDWNPQNDLQAQARCHRIGQQKSVKVYRLITHNTYEREMFDRASLKLGLDKAVLQSMGSKDFSSAQLTKKEIEDLLKKGAYGALMDDDNTGNDFCEEDIDHILQRRTQVVQVQSGVKGSTFAKASFSLSTNRMDIDVDDPHFWQKWAKKADLDADQLLADHDSKDKDALIIEMPRQRRQVSRYGKQDAPVHMSDLESSGGSDDDDGKNLQEIDGRSEHDKGKFSRNDCYNVEKSVLVFGWGRWSNILEFGRFKRKMNEEDVKSVTRAILLYSLKHYDGDDKIKMFIYDLVAPNQDGIPINCHSHTGLSTPVPRGRKGRNGRGKKACQEVSSEKFEEDLRRLSHNVDRIITDPSYKKHLKRHSNKVLLRVRLLYYLQHTIIGSQADLILQGAHSNDVDIVVPRIESDLPCGWWDLQADKSILIGVFKHGYEQYNQMRSDPMLCFLERCGAAQLDSNNGVVIDEHDDDEEMRDEDEDDDHELVSKKSSASKRSNESNKNNDKTSKGSLPFPSSTDLNHRLRKVITTYQKLYKKELLRQEQREKKLHKREQFDQMVREREMARKAALQNRWSRREESEFYRLVSSYGVERDPLTHKITWNKFRSMGHLDKKFDETLTEYFKAFIRMCNKVLKKPQFPVINYDQQNAHKEKEALKSNEGDEVKTDASSNQVNNEKELEGKKESNDDTKVCNDEDKKKENVDGEKVKSSVDGEDKKGDVRKEQETESSSTTEKVSGKESTGDGKNTDEVKVDEKQENKTKPNSGLVDKDDKMNIEKLNEVYNNHPAIYSPTGITLDDPNFKTDLVVEQITEERASRCLARIELLARIREKVLLHPQLQQRLALCQPSSDLPDWWLSGKHDYDLLVGVARHGLSHMDTCILCDPELSFCKLERKSISKKITKENVKKEPSVVSDDKKVSETLDKSKKDVQTSKNESSKMHKEDGFKVEKTKKDEDEEEREMPKLQLEVNVRTSSPPSSLTEELTHEEVPDLEPGALEKNLSEQVNNEAAKSNEDLSKDSDGAEKGVEKVEKDNKINEKDKDGVDKEVKKEVVLKESLDDNEKNKAEMAGDKNEEPKEVSCEDVNNKIEEKSNNVTKDDVDVKDVADKAENKEIKDETKEKSEVDETSVKEAPQNNKQNELIVSMKESNQYEKVSAINSMAAVIENVVSGDSERQKKFGKKEATLKKMDTDEVASSDLNDINFCLPHWPKDRVLLQRLENVCKCVEKGEWPTVYKYNLAGSIDSHCSTPTISDRGCATPVYPLDLASYSSFFSIDRMSETLDSTNPRRRHRRTKAEMEADRMSRLRTYMSGGSQGGSPMSKLSLGEVLMSRKNKEDDSGTSSTEVIKDIDMMNVFKKRRGRKSKIDKMFEAAAIEAMVRGSSQELMMSGSSSSNPYQAFADWTKMLQSVSKHDEDSTLDGLSTKGSNDTKLTTKTTTVNSVPSSLPSISSTLAASFLGNKAISSSSSDNEAEHQEQLQQLQQHLQGNSLKQAEDLLLQLQQQQLPSGSSNIYSQLLKHCSSSVSDMLQQRDIDEQAIEEKIKSELEMVVGQRQKRRSRLDPSKIDLDSLDGSENVSVIERNTGKRITGSKAPPLKHLEEWLVRNPSYDVDPKWSHVVKATMNLPADLQCRVPTPSGRGKRTSSSMATSSLPSSSSPTSNSYSNPSLEAYASLFSNTSTASSTDFYNSLASFMAAAAATGQPGSSFMPPSLTNPMYAASLASLGVLPSLGSYGFEDMMSDSKDSQGLSSKKKQDVSSSNVNSSKSKNSSSNSSRSKNSDDSQKKKSSKSSKGANFSPSSSLFPPSSSASTSSLNPLLGDMDMNSMFGGPFNAFMYNPMLFNQLYAQSLAAFNSTSSASSSGPSSMSDLQYSFLSSFMPPSFDMLPPKNSEKKKSSKSSSKNTPLKPAHAHSKTPVSKSTDDFFSLYTGDPFKQPEKAHTKHSPKPASSASKVDSFLPSSSSSTSDMYSNLFKMPPSFDNLFSSSSPNDQPEDLSLSSKKKPTKANNDSKEKSLSKSSKQSSSNKSSSSKPPSPSVPPTSLPFFLDSSSPMSLFNSSFNFPNLPSYPLKSPFETPSLPPFSSSSFNVSDYMSNSKSSKKDSKTSSKGKKESQRKHSPVSSPSSMMDAEMLMSQFMMSAADMSKYSLMEEQLRMMSSMDLPPFYMPSSFMPPSFYPFMPPTSSSGSSKKSPGKSESSKSKKLSESSEGSRNRDSDSVTSNKKSSGADKNKDDYGVNITSQSKLSSAFNIDTLSISSTSPSLPSFLSPFQPSFPYPPLFPSSMGMNQDDDNNEKPATTSVSSKVSKSKSKSFASIDSISSKLLARKQGGEKEDESSIMKDSTQPSSEQSVNTSQSSNESPQKNNTSCEGEIDVTDKKEE